MGIWSITLVFAVQLYQTHQQRQQFLQKKTGAKAKALLGMKSKNWYETKKWFWEVSYWVPSQGRKLGRLVSTRITIDENDYDRNFEDDRIWVYYLKKQPKTARIDFQVEELPNYQIVLWWGCMGLVLLFIARVIL
ncbi:hypothetical protein BKI52_26610 [marine bacterium AO1-C]|nr:hypothetical protein BKI52_26610 [marine bacterium AO1-C]